MKRSYLIPFYLIIFLLGCSTNEQDVDFLQEAEVQLATPKVRIDSILFKKMAKVEVLHILRGVEIYYTINRSSPKKYIEPFYISETAALEIIAKKSNYQSSEPFSTQLIKLSKKKIEATISLSHSPSENYPGNGPESLLDLERGSLNFKNGNAWSGFQEPVIEIDFNLNKSTELSTIFCSFLQDHNSWIFQPNEIQVWSEGKEIGKTEIAIPKEPKSPRMNFISVNLPENSYKDLKLKIINLKNIPSWHPGAGTPPWLFIDEIILQ